MVKKILKKRKPIWFEHNEDAKGYEPGDNRIMENRREAVRRTWNI